MIKDRKVDYDYSNKMIIINKKIIKLTPSENKFFYAIINKNKISYAELCKIVYNKSIDNNKNNKRYKNRIINTTNKLKAKIKEIGDINNLYGYGYEFIEKNKEKK